jgi:hypothetical protein
MKTVTLQNIGEIFDRLYQSEINFRFENFWDGGYTWALTGYEGDPEPGEIRWTRIEIDNAIDNHIMYPSHEKELDTIHFMKKDWLARGNEYTIEEAVTQLAIAACRIHHDTDFAKWFLT